jgi:hypothetical protein
MKAVIEEADNVAPRFNDTFIEYEAQRIGTQPGDHRLRQSMSLAARRNTTARANWARRWTVLRSVLRRS